MNLKLNGLFLLLGGFLGGYGVYKLMPKSVPQVITVESIKTDIKYKTKIVTLPDGTKTEVTEGESKSALDRSNKPVVKRYGVGLYHDKVLFLEARLGSLPLFLIGETNLKEHRVGIKLEF